MTSKELKELKKFSAQIRVDELEMFRQRGMGHIGGCLSVVELISVLYGKQMKYDPQNPAWEGRDYLVMSKGHAAPTVCAALAEKGFFEKELLLTMDDIGTHAIRPGGQQCDRGDQFLAPRSRLIIGVDDEQAVLPGFSHLRSERKT